MDYATALFPEYFTAPRGRRVKVTDYELTSVDIKTFAALWELKFATVEHIQRYRGLSTNSLPKLRQQLVILSGESKKEHAPKYLQRFYQSRNTPHGTLPYVYGLTEKSKRELEMRGYDVSAFGRVKKVEKRLPSDIDHHFAINDLYLAARDLTDSDPRIEPYELLHDWKLKHFAKRFKVEIYKGNTLLSPYFVPDSLFEFRVNLGDRKAPKRIFVEMDMGTEGWDTIKKKIACYLEFFASGKYVTEFGNVRNVVVLFATPMGDKRAEQLRRWAHEQFDKPLYSPHSYINGTQTPDADDYGLFLFTSLPKGVIDPIQTFLSPVCLPLFDERPLSLIRLPQ